MHRSMAPVPPAHLGRDALSNRDRILAVARRMLSTDPDVAMEAIAEEAGVVRRTLYGHFSSRTALLEGLAAEAANAVASSSRWWMCSGSAAMPGASS